MWDWIVPFAPEANEIRACLHLVHHVAGIWKIKSTHTHWSNFVHARTKFVDGVTDVSAKKLDRFLMRGYLQLSSTGTMEYIHNGNRRWQKEENEVWCTYFLFYCDGVVWLRGVSFIWFLSEHETETSKVRKVQLFQDQSGLESYLKSKFDVRYPWGLPYYEIR